MDAMNKYLEIVDFIFTHGFMCELDAVNVTIVEEDIPILEVAKKPVPVIDRGAKSVPTGVIMIEPEEDLHLLSMLSGKNRFSYHDEYINFKKVIPVTTMHLTINQLTSLIEKHGSVKLLQPKDLIVIHDTIVNFFNALEEVTMFSYTFKGPPDKDLLSLSNLRNIILSSYSNFVKEDDKSQELFNLFSNSFLGSSIKPLPLGSNI